METIINVSNISYSYTKVKALTDISFSISAGDFVALMGMNGAGKSTLLNILHGTLSPEKGDVVFNEKSINKLNPYSSIGFSAQRLVADWFLTVWDNVFMGCLLAGIPYIQSKEMTRNALERVGLMDKINCQMDTLSGGQQQRIQIARAIAHSPQLYILDEPTTGLDAQYAEDIFSFLEQERQSGKTIITSSHDLYLLEKYCNKLIYLEKGRLIYFGDLHNFLKTHHPIIRYQIDLKKPYRYTDSSPIAYVVNDAINPINSTSIEIEICENHSLSEALIEISKMNEILNIQNLSESGLRGFFVMNKEE